MPRSGTSSEHDGARRGVAARQRHLSGVRRRRIGAVAAVTEEPVAHPLDQIPDRRKVDRDLIGEAPVRLIEVSYDRQDPPTIGAGPMLVKARPRMLT